MTCEHEWHGDQATGKNFCRKCGIFQPQHEVLLELIRGLDSRLTDLEDTVAEIG